MLSLAQQISRCQFAIAANFIGDHQRFGRPGKQVDADPTEQLTLGFGSKALPGPTRISTGAIDWVPSPIAATA